MFIVNIQSVKIENIADPNQSNRHLPILSYLDRQYTLVQVFAHSQLNVAQGLWRHLDEQKKVCLIVKDERQYSVWVEKIEQSRSNESIDLRLEPVFRAQLLFIDGLWAEVRELLGANQAAAFGNEILASIPTIKSIKDLLATIAIAMQLDQSIAAYVLPPRQLLVLHQEIQRLAGKYLGRNYTKELLSDLIHGLSPQLKQELQTWLKAHSN